MASVAVAGGLLVGGHVAGADGGLTIDPPSGVPSTPYEVRVSCGDAPQIFRGNTKDGYVQGTIAPYPADDLAEVSPSTWAVQVTAGETDDRFYATCDGNDAGTGRFDAESPHLWFGPRPQFIGGDRDPRTTVEGTDCPGGTTATVEITTDGKTETHQATIDEFGDWTVDLPVPVGQAEMTIDANCGDVEYHTLQATTIPVLPTVTVTETSGPPVTTPESPPAAARPGSSDYTG